MSDFREPASEPAHALITCVRRLVGALVLASACAFGAAEALAQPADAAPLAESELVPKDVVTKARSILDAFAVDHAVSVPVLPNGARLLGVRIVQITPATAQPAPESPRLDLPDWFDPAWVLSRIEQAAPTTVKLLWRVEPVEGDAGRDVAATVELVGHQGYARFQQEGEPATVSVSGRPPGTVFWTDHAIGTPRSSPPGQYNLLLTVNVGGVQTIPLGPVLMAGWTERRADVAERLTQAFPTATPWFAGSIVLAQWYRTTVQRADGVGSARTLLVLSTADWMEDKPNLTEVARVVVQYTDGFEETFPLLLGRHSSSHHYDFHSRSGELQQERAPIAWSTPARLQTVQVDAHVYAARYDLTPGHGAPTAVEVRFVAEEGTLTVHGVATTP